MFNWNWHPRHDYHCAGHCRRGVRAGRDDVHFGRAQRSAGRVSRRRYFTCSTRWQLRRVSQRAVGFGCYGRQVHNLSLRRRGADAPGRFSAWTADAQRSDSSLSGLSSRTSRANRFSRGNERSTIPARGVGILFKRPPAKRQRKSVCLLRLSSR